MKHERVLLSELNSTSTAYKVRVKVIEKGRVTKSPKKGLLYQQILMEDERTNKVVASQGYKMRGALFGDQIAAYKDALQHKGTYEIADASFRSADQQWKRDEHEMDFQMSFGRQTVVQPIDPEAGPIVPDYQCLASVPRVGDPDDRYDVLGVVLYVDEEARSVDTAQGCRALVCEIVISDHSDLVEAECDALSSWAEKFVVVGFTSLRATSHKGTTIPVQGFSLATSISTLIHHDPKGDRPNALTEWALTHKDILSDRQARVLDVRNPSKERVIMTLEELKLKKNTTTLQEERRWLRVVVPEPDFDRVYAYIGCCTCSKRTDVPVGDSYTCTGCSHKDSVASPRFTSLCFNSLHFTNAPH
ncbi:replication protein A 70 kDa DNA-binding subunit B-like [Spinacia oleracea]|uniref:Replication protein A 70 kDa DNA-binding subunit B-like n=1 Tax=Spinacia oleracea TaxID=3562 RepID=A0ABM3RRQ8_SPIOL|nr:replication protein A 70 kDa DNA-binding subunit B-like [Spinacia oleracea]